MRPALGFLRYSDERAYKRTGRKGRDQAPGACEPIGRPPPLARDAGRVDNHIVT